VFSWQTGGGVNVFSPGNPRSNRCSLRRTVSNKHSTVQVFDHMRTIEQVFTLATPNKCSTPCTVTYDHATATVADDHAEPRPNASRRHVCRDSLLLSSLLLVRGNLSLGAPIPIAVVEQTC